MRRVEIRSWVLEMEALYQRLNVNSSTDDALMGFLKVLSLSSTGVRMAWY